MATPRQLRDRLNEVPFQPILRTMSDGRQYPIPNRDAAVVGRNDVMVGVDLDEQSFARRWVRCAIQRITGIEDLRASAPKRCKRKKS